MHVQPPYSQLGFLCHGKYEFSFLSFIMHHTSFTPIQNVLFSQECTFSYFHYSWTRIALAANCSRTKNYDSVTGKIRLQTLQILSFFMTTVACLL